MGESQRATLSSACSENPPYDCVCSPSMSSPVMSSSRLTSCFSPASSSSISPCPSPCVPLPSRSTPNMFSRLSISPWPQSSGSLAPLSLPPGEAADDAGPSGDIRDFAVGLGRSRAGPDVACALALGRALRPCVFSECHACRSGAAVHFLRGCRRHMYARVCSVCTCIIRVCCVSRATGAGLGMPS
mgnify:CR=1 FL=1